MHTRYLYAPRYQVRLRNFDAYTQQQQNPRYAVINGPGSYTNAVLPFPNILLTHPAHYSSGNLHVILGCVAGPCGITM